MPDLSSLAHWSASIKAESLSLFYASRDADVGCATRWLLEFALAYAMSPISLVPDAVPLLGYADSQILVPTLLWLARWFDFEKNVDKLARSPVRFWVFLTFQETKVVSC